FQAEDGIRDKLVTGVQTCALPISMAKSMNAGANASSGARLKRTLLATAPSGMKSSLKSILRTSARMWGMPFKGMSRRPGMMERRSEERRVGKEGRWRGGRGWDTER